MCFAVILQISEPQRKILIDVFHQVKSNLLALNMPPHITLAVFDEVDVQRLNCAVEQFFRSTKPLEVYVSSIGMFPSEQPAVYVQPVVNSELLNMHRRFHTELGDLIDQCWDYYKPDCWVPHLTLGTTDSLSAALDIISVAYNAKLCGSYLLNEISLIEFHPVKVISTYAMNHAIDTSMV